MRERAHFCCRTGPLPHPATHGILALGVRAEERASLLQRAYVLPCGEGDATHIAGYGGGDVPQWQEMKAWRPWE